MSSSSSSGLLPLLAFRRDEESDLTLPWRDVNNASSSQVFVDITGLNTTTREEVQIDVKISAVGPIDKYPGVTPGRHREPAASRMEETEEPNGDDFFSRILPHSETFEEHSAAVRIETPSMLTSQLDALVDCARREKVIPLKGSTWNGSILRVLLHMASLMNVNLNTIFAAIEIFDRFTIEFNDNLRPVLADLFKKGNAAEVAETRNRIRSQVPLRMASCLQLCDKLHSDLSTPDLTLSTIENILTSLSFFYTKSAIAKSETRVFSTLNFRLGYPTAWEVATTLLASLPNLSSSARATITQLTASLLFMSFEHHSAVLDALWEIHVAANPDLPVAWKDAHDSGIHASPRLHEERENWRRSFYEDLVVILGGGALATAFTILRNSPTPRGASRSDEATLKSDMTKEIARHLRTPVMRIFDMSIALLRVSITSFPDFLKNCSLT